MLQDLSLLAAVSTQSEQISCLVSCILIPICAFIFFFHNNLFYLTKLIV